MLLCGRRGARTLAAVTPYQFSKLTPSPTWVSFHFPDLARGHTSDVVVPDGFEPPQAEPKSAVLPLDEGTIKSGKQDSNLRPRTWKERALPTELLPQKPQHP